MPNRPVAAVTIIALSLLAVCCQMIPVHHLHDMAEHLPATAAHLLLLTMDVPLAVLTAVLLTALLFMAAWYADSRPQGPARISRPTAQPPDFLCAIPLRLALTGGLLNPKPF